MVLDPFVSVLAERPDRGRRDAELRNSVSVDHLPEAVRLRVVWCTLVHHHRPAGRVVPDQRPRPHHPADVGDPEEPVGRLLVEAEVDLLGALREDARVGVDDPLRLAGGPGGVQQHGLLIAREPLRLVVDRPRLDRLGPRHVAIRVPRNRVRSVALRRRAQAVVDDDVIDVAGCLYRLVGGRFQSHLAPATVEPVPGEQDRRLGVCDPSRRRLRAEAGENRHCDRAHL